jgi:hypothetical protein
MSAIDERRRRLGPVLLISLIVLGAILRAAALGVGSGHLAEDRDDYLAVAKQYVARGFWLRFEGIPNSFRPPLYPLVLAAILKAGGGSAALGLLQLTLGMATVALTCHIGQKLGLGSLSAIAGGLVALDPLLIEYTTFPMTETLFTFLVVLLVAVATPESDGRTGQAAESSSVANQKGSQGISRWPTAFRAAVVGAVFGACALCRPTIWPVAGLAALWLLQRLHRTHGRLRELLLPGAAAALAVAIVVSPWMLRNWKILGSPIVTTTHGGYTLLLGNNREFFHQVAARPLMAEWRDSQPDRFQRPWFRDLVAEMDRQLGPAAGEIAQDRWMYRRAGQEIAAEPRLFLRACVLRFVEFWNVVPLPPSRSAVSSFVIWGLCIGYSIELALFVAGLGTLFRRWDDRWMLPLLLILNFTLVHLFYWSNMRMRAPIVPLIALVAARAIAAWRDRRKVNKYVDFPPASAKT